ncbi:MAG TPA: hypothetical protein VFZ97_08355 [Acidimicrobiales bacterium]
MSVDNPAGLSVRRERVRRFAVWSYGVVALGYLLLFFAFLDGGIGGFGPNFEGFADAVANGVLCGAVWLLATHLPLPLSKGLRSSLVLVATAEVLMGVGNFALASIEATSFAGLSLIVIGIGNLLFAGAILYGVGSTTDDQAV